MLECIWYLRPAHPSWEGLQDTSFTTAVRNKFEGSPSILEELCAHSSLSTRTYSGNRCHGIGGSKGNGSNLYFQVAGAKWHHSASRGKAGIVPIVASSVTAESE